MTRAAAVLLVMLALPRGSTAQPAVPPTGYQTPEYIRRSPTLPAEMSGGKAWKLTLAEAIETAMRRNLDLALQRERQVEIDTGPVAARAAFEPVLQASVNRLEARSPPATSQEIAPGQAAGQVLSSSRTGFALSVAERLPTGTAWQLAGTSGLAESMLGTAVAPRVFRADLTLSLTQPLLRDFSFDLRVPRAPVLRAVFATEAVLEETRLRAMLTIKAIEDSYWTLVESYKTYEVNVGARELAERQLELTRRQITAGVLPESDVIGVEGTLAQRELAVVRAEVQIERAADLLRTLMNLAPPDWERPLVPIDVPGFLPITVPFEAALSRALAARPELRHVQVDLRRLALDLDVARNSRLPRLDVVAAAGVVGQDENSGTAFDQLSHARGRQWSVGLNLAWAPIGGAARAEVRRLQSALRGTGLGREQIVASMRAEIREALRAIATAARQLAGSARFRELAERSLEVEERRFLNSLSSNFVVAQRQAELAQARLSELEALIQHEKAASDLQLAMGELLEARHLQFLLHPAS
jgi:outer membrane protein TolC